MKNNWKYVKPLEDVASVRVFLIKNGIKIPENLIEILEKNNGGRPSEKSIITETQREYVFKSLLSYNNDDLENIYSLYSDSFKDRHLYPLGSDAAGNIICFDYSVNKYVLLNHETNEPEIITRMSWI